MQSGDINGTAEHTTGGSLKHIKLNSSFPFSNFYDSRSYR